MENDLLNAIEMLINKKLTSTEKEYFDVQEACFFLGISKSTIYKFNFRKVIPYFVPTGSKKCYYLKSDLQKYLSENRFMSKREMDEQANNFLTQMKGGNYVR